MTALVSRSEWLAARQELLAAEKSFTQQRDALSEQRRQLPWVLVEKDYQFQRSGGVCTLSDLFGGFSQLIVQHFMLGDDWGAGCPSCSFWADGYEGMPVHLAQRDAAFVAVSSAPLEQIEAFKRRMGWSFDWVSCAGGSFNKDYRVSFAQDEVDAGNASYNYSTISFPVTEAPGVSVFVKQQDGTVCHTYSCYARGLDMLNVTYQYLDLLPHGRNEDELPHPMAWVRRRDEYSG